MQSLAHDEGTVANVEPGEAPDMLAHALGYASGDTLGMALRVFPLAPGTKVPAIPKAAGGAGVHDATADRAQVAAWWDRYPGANVGLACGGGLLAVDVDVKGDHDGRVYLDAAMARHGQLPNTVGQVTPSGGFHLLYSVPVGRTLRKAAHLGLRGVDLQYSGRYIVAAPSRLEGSPEGYRLVAWRGRCLVPLDAGERPTLGRAPGWLLEPVVAEGTRMLREVCEAHAARYQAGTSGTPEGLDALEGLCAWLGRQPLGNVNEGLNWAAYVAGGYVASGHLDEAHAERMLREAAMDAGHHLRHNVPDPRAAAGMEATLASGLNDGRMVPAEPRRPLPAQGTRVKGLGSVAGGRGPGTRVKGLRRG